MPKKLYRIGEAARISGVSASTLRLWESQGLIKPERTSSGQRLYSNKAIVKLRRILWLRRDRGLNPVAIRDAMRREEGKDAIDRIVETDIGRRLRTLRNARGETLAKTAAKVGIAASALSTLERTSRGTSLKTLKDIAAHFKTSISELSGESSQNTDDVVRANSRKKWPQVDPGVTIELLANGRRQMDCHRFVLAPGTSSHGAYRHKGEEFIFVLKGELTIVLEEKATYKLRVGDSIYFKSSRNHAWTNSSSGETVLLWVNTPPTF